MQFDHWGIALGGPLDRTIKLKLPESSTSSMLARHEKIIPSFMGVVFNQFTFLLRPMNVDAEQIHSVETLMLPSHLVPLIVILSLVIVVYLSQKPSNLITKFAIESSSPLPSTLPSTSLSVLELVSGSVSEALLLEVSLESLVSVALKETLLSFLSEEDKNISNIIIHFTSYAIGIMSYSVV